jgi:hypothetical protein
MQGSRAPAGVRVMRDLADMEDDEFASLEDNFNNLPEGAVGYS